MSTSKLRLFTRLVVAVITVGAAAVSGACSERSDGRRGVSTPASPTALAPGGAAGLLTPSAVTENSTSNVTFPPRNEPFDFRANFLEPKYRDQLRRPLQSSAVDVEGTIVWTQEYLRYRVNGCGHIDAVNRVFSQIEGRGIAAVCSPVTGTPVFPPRNEPFDFRQRLEIKYRDELRRGAVQSAVDVEGDIVWTQEYLRYRVTGCAHRDAIDKVMAQIDGRGVQPDCAPVPPTRESCSYSLGTNAGTVPVAGGSFTAMVSTQSGCGWRLSSNQPWLTLSGNSTGSGSGGVAFSVAANPTGAAGRSAILTLNGDGAGASVVVSQSGSTVPQCTFSVSPSSVSVAADGGDNLQVSVSTSAGCVWSASSLSSFVSITSGATGSGTGGLRFSVASNTSSSPRTGTIRVSYAGGSQDVTITQGAANVLVADFTVNPQPCVLTASSSFTGPSTDCTFDAGASQSTEGIARYEWNFGPQASFTPTNNGRVVPRVSFGCGLGSGEIFRDVTVTIFTASGRSASRTKAVRFRKDSGC
jgi:hypothetical protein